MNKVLYSLLVIGIVSSIVVGSGAIAQFRDTEASTGNTFTAGTLDLKVDGADNPGAKITISSPYLKPTDTGSTTIALKNAGTLSGGTDTTDFTMAIGTSTEAENTWLDPEKDDGDTSSDVGELGANLKLKVDLYEDEDADGTIDSADGMITTLVSENELTDVDATTYDITDCDADTPGNQQLDSGMGVILKFSWVLPGSTTDVVQSDTSTFSLTFVLSQ